MVLVRKLLAVLTGLALCGPVLSAETCATLDACLGKVPAVASSSPGVGPEERALAKALQRHGARAIPGLIKLLESGSESSRKLASYTLRDIQGLGPEHLPALTRARLGGDGWIPLAIASVGTPEAIAFLV